MIELEAGPLVAGGASLARDASGRVVFVAGALPGERVRARIVEERRDYARAVAVDVREPSTGRRAPPCPFVAHGCGGCTWQHLDPAFARAAKVALLRDALARTGRLGAPHVVEGPVLDDAGFRTSLRLAVARDGRAGFRAYHSHALVHVSSCLVAHPLLADLLDARYPGAREVRLRCGGATGERSLLTTPASAARGLQLPPDVACGPRAAIHEEVVGVRLRVSAASFFQSRADGAAALVALVAGHLVGLPDGARMVDAYAGVGLFAAAAGARFEVVAIEQSRPACRDARVNLSATRARIVGAAVERWRPEPADVVVADPPRRGLGERAVEVLTGSGAARFVLVSCDPVSLARDARLLDAAGYDHEVSTVVDLFPHTPHVEVVTSFRRR